MKNKEKETTDQLIEEGTKQLKKLDYIQFGNDGNHYVEMQKLQDFLCTFAHSLIKAERKAIEKAFMKASENYLLDSPNLNLKHVLNRTQFWIIVEGSLTKELK